MMARYRLIQFVPDPFERTRLTVGALVDSGMGGPRLARARHFPGPAFLGSKAAWTVLQLILDGMASAPFDMPSGEASPLALLSDPEEIPAGADDPFEWVERAILPKPYEAPGALPQRPHRVTVGARFLRQYGVEQYVKRNYRAEQELGPLVTPLEHPISQWVAGRDTLLFLEPVVGTRPSLEDDLKRINETILAHRQLFQSAHLTRKVEFLVYVLPLGYGGAVKDTRRVLSMDAAGVLNVDEPGERRQLLSSIREIGIEDVSI
jgi:hypothetical protein